MADLSILTDETIDGFINQEGFNLVCFFTSEEDSQYQFEEVMKRLAAMQEKVHVGEIDAFKYPEKAKFYNAKWFPTLVMYEAGEYRHYTVGEAYEDDIIECFKEYF